MLTSYCSYVCCKVLMAKILWQLIVDRNINLDCFNSPCSITVPKRLQNTRNSCKFSFDVLLAQSYGYFLILLATYFISLADLIEFLWHIFYCGLSGSGQV